MKSTTAPLFTYFLLAAALSTLANADLPTSTVKQFQTGPFTFPPSAGIYNLTGLGLNLTGGATLMAFGDFNSDKFTDLVTLDDSNTTITIFLWYHDNYLFNLSQTLTLTNKIVGVIPADLDFDGLVDILILTSNAATGLYDYTAFLGTRSDTPFDFTNDPILTFSYPPQQPTVVYLDDTFKVSFLLNNPTGARAAFSFVNGTDDTGKKTLQLVETPFVTYVSTNEGCLGYSQVESSTIKIPNFNSFIDLNGDCRPDLFIMSVQGNTTYFETWIRDSTTATFCLIENTPIASNVASLAFADVNGDAGIDLVYIQQDTVPTVHLIYNQFKNAAGSACKGYTANSTNCPFWNPLDVNRSNIYDSTVNNSATIVYPLSNQGGIPVDAKLYSYDPVDRPHQLRFGDVNMDGYADLLVTVQNSDKTRKTWVLYNTMTANTSVRALSTNAPSDLILDINVVVNDTNSYYGTFFDFDELGTQSFFYVKADAELGITKIEGYFNYLNRGSSFLKALGLNGAQYGSDFYAGMYFGSSFECEVTNINGANVLKKGSQLSRGSYAALQLPYSYLGLGTTNNYIENFVFGLPLSNANTQTWSQIIPNSQLIITPLGTTTSNWKIGVFVKPTASTITVVLLITGILIICGLIIIFLQKREKEEDGNDKPAWARFG